ncbi:transposase [Streptomyces sp. HUAS TT7]|uniref:transposase n=1 Tax=Streptomyces sp. HUAS TT7 TaxID=3447507 RepID=UPI003F657178
MIGVDDFALRRRHRYATVVIDAETHERIDVLPDARPTRWRRGCASVRASRSCAVTARATYAEAIRRALPDAVQVGDRRHLWKNL